MRWRSIKSSACGRAFSLVELSIVLVILGLLVGGVLSGQALIRASELRSVITQHSEFITAIHSFKDKYFYLPGDMPNAGSFWGLNTGTPATCWSAPQISATSICNGNGDGLIGTGGAGSEDIMGWQMLVNAGLITGGPYTLTTAVGSPLAKISPASWNMWDLATIAAGGDYAFVGVYGNSLMVNDANAGTGIMIPAELYNLDTKLDDGKPGQGAVVIGADDTIFGGIVACTTTGDTSDLSASYLLSSSDKACWPIFRKQF